MNTAVMKNWSIYDDNPLLAPELKRPRLQGKIYEDSREYFPDGANVCTSSIKNIENFKDYKIVVTKNTRYKISPEDVDPEYEKMFPEAYERLEVKRGETDEASN